MDKGELSTDNYLVTRPFREKYLRHNLTLVLLGRLGTDNVVLNPLSLSLIPQGQPPRPNTAVQYPVFNPEPPRLQSSPSPLHARSWSNLLRYYPGDLGSTIAGILTYGVQVGYRGKKQTRYSSNHQIHEPGMITAKLAEDLNLGRVRLASRPSFVSPLGLVPQHDGGWRRIHDLSWPPGQGLNQGIPDSWSAIEYMTIDDIYNRSYKLAQVAQFRIVPVAEDNQHLLAFQWTDSIYVEYDYITITQSPSVSDPTGLFDQVYNGITGYLRIPRNTKKDQQGTCVTVLGIQIDSIAMEARLPPEKLCRATLDAAAALNAASLSLKQAERLTGLLAFCSRRAPPYPYEVRDDLEWWRDSLSLFNGVLLIDPCRRPITHLYTDASSTGQGLFFFSSKSTLDCWLAHCHQLHPSNAATLALAQDAHAHINTNEVDAILQGFLLFSHHWLHHTLVIHTDSSTAHAGLKKGFLHGPPNAPLKSLLILAAARDIHIVPHWLPSGENKLADALSPQYRPPKTTLERTQRQHTFRLPLRSAQLRKALRATKYPRMASFKIFFDLMVKRTTPWYASQKAVKPDTALADLAALRAYHIDNFLDDKLFDNKHFQRLIDGARRLNPVTKIRTDRRHEGVQINLAKTGDGACPVDALQKLLLLDPRGPDAPLFSFHRRPFSRNNFLSTLSTKLRALGLRTEGYSGHSFRKGAAQHAHDSGILDDQIQMLGRWTSEAFSVYFTANASVLYKLDHQFQTGSPSPLSLLLTPPSPPPS
ncbi:hypothetical protein HAV15_011132 [Penicillium sp. str. |nr:hypothetical protein HAV15_011132 [Penicillium sp. str. \